jgi:hypothetical protein
MALTEEEAGEHSDKKETRSPLPHHGIIDSRIGGVR